MQLTNNFTEKDMPITKQAFPNFSLQMYRGNAPAGKGHDYIIDGVRHTSDRWSTAFGGGQSVDGIVMYAQFNLNSKVCVSIIGNTVIITDIRYSGKTDMWAYSSCVSASFIGNTHELQDEKIVEYLNATVDDCMFWKMVQNRCKDYVPQYFK